MSMTAEQYIAKSESGSDIFGAHTRLRKIQRLLLDTENRMDEIINP